MAPDEAGIQLPTILVSKADAHRLLREFEALEDYLHQAALRKEDPSQIQLPKTSRMLDELASLNKLDLLHKPDHDRALQTLRGLADHAPLLHISFSSEPSSAFLAKLMMWLRTNIDPLVLVNVGLQPAIAAGCVIRTKNKQFDLSLGQSFKKHRKMLAEELRAPAVTQPAEPTNV